MNPTLKAKFLHALRLLAVFIVTFDAAFLWQKISGAHESEFGAHPDEAAHYVTGLFVRDAIGAGVHYAAGGFQGSPGQVGKAFAENFYEHYPKVALGVWPPAFYVVQSAWTLPFGESRMSLMLLMAVLAGAVGAVLFEATRRAFGMWPGVAAAALWLCAPLVREYYGMVMAEMLSTLCIFGATLLWGRYLDERRKGDALWFALLASAAILTKGTGMALVLMCGLSIVFRRAWAIFRQPSLWVSLLLIAVLAGIWTWTFRGYGVQAGGWEDNSGGLSWAFTQRAIPFYGLELAKSVGYATAGFGLVGMVAMFRKNGRWAALSALVLGVWIFQILLPVGREERHLLPATPALVLLAIAGLYALSRSRVLKMEDGAVQHRRELLWVLLLALLVLPFAVTTKVIKAHSGFEALALHVLEKNQPGMNVLVSSDASGEGMFISEVAMRDRRPNLYIRRGSKVLVDPKSQSWSGRDQRLRFGEDAELVKYFREGKIDYIVLDDAVEEKRTAYHDQLRRVIEDNAGLFFRVLTSPVTRDGEDLFRPLALYRVVRHEGVVE